MKRYFLNCSEMLVLVLSSTCYGTFVSGAPFSVYSQARIGGLSSSSGSLIPAGLSQWLGDIFPLKQT